MAYTIISQNNTTTTLSDENGNVITVPARVTLATSTDYTITKVNNNSVDLEDGDGKIIRGVPACVVLAGEGGGGGGLPSQTGNAGKFLTTDGTDASWSDKPLVNNTYPNTSRLSIGDSATCYASVALAIGKNATASSQGSTAIGEGSYAGGSYSIAIAGGHTSGIRAIQIGSGLNNNATNSDRDTVKIANSNGNFEIMSADGTVPTARLTKVNTTATLAVADWSSNTQTVSVTGMTANGVVLVSPTPANQSAYTSAGILCTAQAAGSLTFTCDTVPSADITVTVVML